MRKLLDAAMVAFDKRGYYATRVNDVVDIAKTSHGTFYLYFSNKEALLRALVTEAPPRPAPIRRPAVLPSGTPQWRTSGGSRLLGTVDPLCPALPGLTDLATIDQAH
jgi:AcrR family transcriptional regulator